MSLCYWNFPGCLRWVGTEGEELDHDASIRAPACEYRLRFPGARKSVTRCTPGFTRYKYLAPLGMVL
jgi:hypothetical protein